MRYLMSLPLGSCIKAVHIAAAYGSPSAAEKFMATLERPMPYSHYPSSASVQHAGRSVPDDAPGSFGPVLVVMAVISFLGVAACVAGRLCGRSSSSRGNSAGQQSAEADKGSATKQLEVMRPLPSSRATVHDVDDAFEIMLVPQKPPTGSEASGGGVKLQALPVPQRQLGAPRHYPAPAAGAVGFKGQASANTGPPRQAHLLDARRASSMLAAQQRR